MASISNYIASHLLAPLKQYPTLIQDTMLEIITEKFERLYEYSKKFPSIVTPNKSRLDILQAIADQFLFTIREEADLQEQIDILDKILYVYGKRGSIDTIENMWRYYGGDLPKDVQVIVPSYNIFRYNVSALSSQHTLLKGRDSYIDLDTPSPADIDAGLLVNIPEKSRNIVITHNIVKGDTRVSITNVLGLEVGDRVSVNNIYSGTIVGVSATTRDALYDSVNTPGVYEIRLYNSTYPIPELKEFLLKELVAAGNEIYFTNALYMQSLSEDISSDNSYTYRVYTDDLVKIQLEAMKPVVGLHFSGDSSHLLSLYDKENPPSILSSEADSYWSGSGSLFIELAHVIDLSVLGTSYMSGEGKGLGYNKIRIIGGEVKSLYDEDRPLPSIYHYESREISLRSSYESMRDMIIDSDFERRGYQEYPDYFILGKTNLGELYSI